MADLHHRNDSNRSMMAIIGGLLAIVVLAVLVVSFARDGDDRTATRSDPGISTPATTGSGAGTTTPGMRRPPAGTTGSGMATPPDNSGAAR
jgi:hypothetical protein